MASCNKLDHCKFLYGKYTMMKAIKKGKGTNNFIGNTKETETEF